VKPKKRRKVKISPNSKFVSIKAIQIIQEALRIEQEEAEELDISISEADYIEV
jgi:5-methylcytosine-specific restriction endonuclease McrBC GTP-binding regulatory subunit McrB